MLNISNRWDKNIPTEPLDPSKPAFTSKKYTYFGSSLDGQHWERFIRVLKITGVVLATLAIIPIPVLILIGGYGSAGKAIQDLHHDIHIEGRAPTKANFSKLLKNYISQNLMTPEINDIINNLPDASISPSFLFLKSCKKLRNEGLPIGKSAYERDLTTHQVIWEKVLTASAKLSSHELANIMNILKFCDQFAMPMTQNVEMVIAGEHAVPLEYKRQKEWLEQAKEFYTSSPESDWVAEGYVRQHPPLNLFEKFTCAKQPENDLLQLTLTTRIPEKSGVSERSKSFLIDLRPLREERDTPFDEEQQKQLRHGLVSKDSIPKWLTNTQKEKLEELRLLTILEMERALAYVYER